MCADSRMAVFRSFTLKCSQVMSSKYFRNYRNKFLFALVIIGVTFTCHVRCLSVSGSLYFSVGVETSVNKHVPFLSRSVMSSLLHGMVLCVIICLFHIIIT
jgi:hypothetical protein